MAYPYRLLTSEEIDKQRSMIAAANLQKKEDERNKIIATDAEFARRLQGNDFAPQAVARQAVAPPARQAVARQAPPARQMIDDAKEALRLQNLEITAADDADLARRLQGNGFARQAVAPQARQAVARQTPPAHQMIDDAKDVRRLADHFEREDREARGAQYALVHPDTIHPANRFYLQNQNGRSFIQHKCPGCGEGIFSFADEIACTIYIHAIDANNQQLYQHTAPDVVTDMIQHREIIRGCGNQYRVVHNKDGSFSAQLCVDQ